MAVKSASNVAERTPVKTKGKAAQKGAIGAALAEIFFQMEEKKANQVMAEQKTMKERLKEIADLPGTAEHIAFRETLDVHVKAINAEADRLKVVVTKGPDHDKVLHK